MQMCMFSYCLRSDEMYYHSRELWVYFWVSSQLVVPRNLLNEDAQTTSTRGSSGSELPPDVRPHPFIKLEPIQPIEETHFSFLFLQFHAYSHYPQLITMTDLSIPCSKNVEMLQLLQLGATLTLKTGMDNSPFSTK